MSDTPETPRRAPRALTVLAGIAIVFLLLAGAVCRVPDDAHSLPTKYL